MGDPEIQGVLLSSVNVMNQLQDQASNEVGKPCLANCSLGRLQCSRPVKSNRLNDGFRDFKRRLGKQGPTCGVMFTEEL